MFWTVLGRDQMPAYTRIMRRRSVLVIVAAAIGILAGGGVLVAPRGQAEHIYTVAQVDAGLALSPAAWIGRTLDVQGKAVIPTCTTAACRPGASDRLIDLRAPGQQISLMWSAVNPLLRTLMGIPFLRSVVADHVGGAGVYRVLILRTIKSVRDQGVPDYYPYNSRTVVVIKDTAVLVGSLD